MNDHPSARLPADKRHRLFATASGEFAAKGFTRASLNRIISRVKMSKSSFYHYFSSKSDLFRQTMIYAMAPVHDIAITIEFRSGTADEIWQEIADAFARALPVVQDSPLIITAGRMFYRSREDAEGQALTDDFLDQFSTWISGLLKQGQALGAFRDDLPESLLIDLILSMGMAMDRWMLEHWDDLDDAQRMRFSQAGFDLLRRVLAPT